MSVFPTGGITSERRAADVDGNGRLETDGVLVRPIGGQIYLIEEEDLAATSGGDAHSRLSGLVSRH